MNTTLQALEQAKQVRSQTLAAYRAQMYHQLTLSKSGLEIWVRDATMTDLMLLGTLPQSLLNAILAQAEGENPSIDLNGFAGSPDFGKLVNGIVICCAVEPPIAEVGDEQHLGLTEICGEDRMEIFAWANREVAANASNFRDKTKQPDPAAPSGGDLRGEAISMDELQNRMGLS